MEFLYDYELMEEPLSPAMSFNTSPNATVSTTSLHHHTTLSPMAMQNQQLNSSSISSTKQLKSSMTFPSCIPAHPLSFLDEWQAKTEECDRRAAAHADQVTNQCNSHGHPLPNLTIGQQVQIQDPTSLHWNEVWIVIGCGRLRQYEVPLPSGRVW